MASTPKAAAHTFKKYTVQPTGIWALVSKWLQIDSSRSTGIPMNRFYRNPPPAAGDPRLYDDPITVPAGDIAENPYWKRDMRRAYPILSVVNQGDIVGLLTVGSQSSPKDNVLQIGDAGTKQLVAVKEEALKGGLSAFFKRDRKNVSGVLGPTGLPPNPFNLAPNPAEGKRYELQPEQSYKNKYPCRSFT